MVIQSFRTERVEQERPECTQVPESLARGDCRLGEERFPIQARKQRIIHYVGPLELLAPSQLLGRNDDVDRNLHIWLGQLRSESAFVWRCSCNGTRRR